MPAICGRSRILGLALALALVGGVAGCEEERGLEITNIEPKTGPHTGGSSVTIMGHGFQEGGAKGVKVYFGDRPAQVMHIEGNDKLIVVPPPAEVGDVVDVTILFDDARQHVYEKAYTYVDMTQGFGVDALTEGEEAKEK